MSENVTIARPYAKAVFDLAKKTKKLDEWDILLSNLSVMMSDKSVVIFIKDRTISYNEKSRVIIDILKTYDFFSNDMQGIFTNFIGVLAYYGRLLCVNDIYYLYRELMNFELGRVEAIVKVAVAISSSQKEEIINCLSKRFNKKISAFFEIDKDLLGGFLIKVGDFVLDASIAGNLVSLRSKIFI